MYFTQPTILRNLILTKSALKKDKDVRRKTRQSSSDGKTFDKKTDVFDDAGNTHPNFRSRR